MSSIVDDASGDELLTINRAGVRLTAEGERRRDQRWQLGPPQAHWQPAAPRPCQPHLRCPFLRSRTCRTC